MQSLLVGYAERSAIGPSVLEGQVTQVLGTLVEGTAMGVAVGDLCGIDTRMGLLLAEVVALRGRSAMMMPFGDLVGVTCGDAILPMGEAVDVGVSDALCGRVIDSLGRPLDGGPAIHFTQRRSVHGTALTPMQRRPVDEPLPLGVRALDAFIPCGRGQRLGVFAPAGAGKSVLLGMITRGTAADVTVVALVGERGREVGHFVDKILGTKGLERSVIVVATSDRPAPERLRAAAVATTIAEYFRDEHKDVLLCVDSLTRLCMAQREIGLSVGEPPATRGYPPSSFSMLPRLLERAAPARDAGSITGIYTVLIEGEPSEDPVGETVRGLLDGHIILSPELAAHGQYPAIDILRSLSRLAPDLSDEATLKATQRARGWLARIEDARDLISVGAYRAGMDPDLDEAIAHGHALRQFLKQSATDIADPTATRDALCLLVGDTP